jgi:Tol biopolymer transport system component
MSRVAAMHLLASARMGPLLLAAIGSASCDSTAPGTGSSPGGLAVVTSTAGVQPDNDGYTIMVDGTAHGAIGPNDSLSVEGVDPGSHAVELADIEFNCATLGQFTRTVSVGSNEGAVVDYSVACDAASRSRIAFVKDHDYRTAEVLVVNADGSSLASLTDSLGAVRILGRGLPPVAWSTDGNRVAFTREEGGLYATTGEGTGVIQLAPAGSSPSWSGDGRKVAFMARDPAPDSDFCCWNIFVAESNGSGVTRVTEGLSLLKYDLAADGSMITFEDQSTSGSGVFVVRPDGTGLREIVPPGAHSPQMPSLSPDGTKVAYYAYADAQDESGPSYEIYVSPTDGSGPTINVSNNPGYDWWPVWSPDGTRIAFLSRASPSFGPGSLHVVNADGTGQITITPDENMGEPVWSPDGTRVAYTGGAGHVYVANADGSGRTDITPDVTATGTATRPTWTGQ